VDWRKKYDVGDGEVADSAAAVTWVREDLDDTCPGCGPVVDVAVLGTSHGGGISAGMAFRFPDLADGYAVTAGISDWAALYDTYIASGEKKSITNQIRISMGGTPAEVPSEYQARSALFNVGAVQRSIQILWGATDSTVPPSQSTLYRDALLGAAKDVHAQSFAGGHNFMVQSSLSEAPWQTFLTWAVSVLWPDTSIVQGPAALTNDTTADFELEGSRPGSTFECRLDGAPDWSSCPPSHSVGTLTEGAHTLEVRALADGEVDPAPATHAWEVDLTPPDTQLDSGPVGPTASTSATFTFSSPDAGPGGSFRCRVDGGDWGACTSPVGMSGLSQGPHTFDVAAVDGAGNEDATPATRSWTVDTVAPDTTIDSGPTGTVASSQATFGFSSPTPDDVDRFECRVDSGAFATCTSPKGVTVADGAHTFEVRAVDAAGNLDGTPASRAWTADTTAPQTTIQSGPPSPTTDTSASFTFTASEDSTFACSLDEGTAVPCSSGVSYGSLGQGPHQFSVAATDTVGNTDLSPATWAWTVGAPADSDPPETTITDEPPEATNSTTASFSFESDEPGSTFLCRFTGAAFASCSSPYTRTGMKERTWTFEVKAVDGNGNVDPTPATWTFTIDLTPPNTTITAGPSGTVPTGDATFEFTSSQPGTIECKLDAGAFAPCTSPTSYTGLGAGSHTFSVRAIDPAGNVDGTPATRTWTVGSADTTPPETTVTSAPSSVPAGSPASFEFTSNEPGSTFQCRVKPDAFATCTSPHQVTKSVPGQYTFVVRAIDPAGNVDPTPESRTFTVAWTDTTPPETTMVSGPANGTVGPVTFEFTSSEAGSTFVCRLKSLTTFTSCTSPTALEGRPAGTTTTFQVRATDAAGNVDTSAAAWTWTSGGASAAGWAQQR
jgi:dienelactone hydrolase